MAQTIDVTELPDTATTDRRFVEALRPEAAVEPPTGSPVQWATRFRAWAASHTKLGVIADDSRESIYEGRDE